MKKIISTGIAMLISVVVFGVGASERGHNLTCKGKENAIKNEMEYANKYNQTERIRGLEKALSDVKLYCSNKDLEKDYLDEVQEKLNELSERKQDLEEVKLSGKLDKIDKKTLKLQETQKELSIAQFRLEEFYKELSTERE